MKRSFYEMLDVPRKATQEQIDIAFAKINEKLGADTSVRGKAETMTELNIIREGYNILSNAEKRAVYDAKLYATEAGIQLMFFPKDTKAVKKLGINTVIFAALACVFTYMMYQKLTRESNVVRFDQVTTAKPAAAGTMQAEAPKPGAPAAAPANTVAATEPAARTADAKTGAKPGDK